MRILLILLMVCTFFPFSVNGAETKGIKVVITDNKKKEIGFYTGSYALVVGASDYTQGWPDLPSIPDELREVEESLEQNGFTVRKVINPNSSQLYDAYRNFINEYGYDKDNRLLFFFSGHGYSRMKGEKGYLVPVDAPDPRKDEKGFLRKALTMTDILGWAKKMEAKHALFLFDSCFSGTIFKTRALPERPPHISVYTARPVRQFITAGSEGEEVPARSVFTPSFVRALRGEGDLNGDTYVTGTELGMYLTEKVLGYATYQTPQYGKIRDPHLDEGDFVFQIRPPVQQRTAVEDTQSFFAKGKQFYKEEKYQEALRWYRKAADAGDTKAQNNIGIMYVLGNGLEQDYQEAMRWYRKAADVGDTRAQTNLGYMYEGGYGVEKDYKEAMRWYRRAADAGYADAQYAIGYMYQYGYGVEKDYKEALRWYRKAAAQGNTAAIEALERLQ